MACILKIWCKREIKIVQKEEFLVEAKRLRENWGVPLLPDATKVGNY